MLKDDLFFVIFFLDNRGHERITVWKVSFHSLQSFSGCTWNEPCESPRGLMLFFPESGFTEKTIRLFLCMLCGPLGAQCLIHYEWALNCLCTLLLRAKCERSQEELIFQWKILHLLLTKVEGILHIGTLRLLLMWEGVNGRFFFWMTAFFVQFH